MIRSLKLLVLATVFSLGFSFGGVGCDNRSVRVAAPSGEARVLAAALVDDLRRNKLAAHRVECEGELDCSALLLSGDVDIAVLSTRTASMLSAAHGRSSSDGGPRLIATAARAYQERVVAADPHLRTIDQLRVRAVGLRVAMQAEFAARSEGGFATLARMYGLSRATRLRFDSDHQSLAALERGEVDVAIVEQRALSGSHMALVDPRGSLSAARLAFVAFGDQGVADDGDVRMSATRIGANVISVVPITLVVPSAVEHELRLPIRALTRAFPDKQIATLRPGAQVPEGAPWLELRYDVGANTLNDPPAQADSKRENPSLSAKAGDPLVTFDSGSGPPLTLVQHGDLFDREDAGAILRETAIARIPKGPSIWTRARKNAPRAKTGQQSLARFAAQPVRDVVRHLAGCQHLPSK